MKKVLKNNFRYIAAFLISIFAGYMSHEITVWWYFEGIEQRIQAHENALTEKAYDILVDQINDLPSCIGD